jgi:hypothetical protein
MRLTRNIKALRHDTEPWVRVVFERSVGFGGNETVHKNSESLAQRLARLNVGEAELVAKHVWTELVGYEAPPEEHHEEHPENEEHT